MKADNPIESQAVLSISQLMYFNLKGNRASDSLHHCKEHEPPLPLYVGLNIHTNFRSRKAVETMYRLGLSIGYDRVLVVEKSLAASACKQFEEENLVCPASFGEERCRGLPFYHSFTGCDYNLTICGKRKEVFLGSLVISLCSN